MPQLIALALAGAGLYAGYKWLAKEIGKAGAEAERMREAAERRAGSSETGDPNSGTGPLKDLGALEWDEAAGVYRPRTLN